MIQDALAFIKQIYSALERIFREREPLIAYHLHILDRMGTCITAVMCSGECRVGSGSAREHVSDLTTRREGKVDASG